MDSIFVARGTADAIPIWFVTAATYPDIRKLLGAEAGAFADAAGFEPKAGRHLMLPGKGGLGGILFGLEGRGRAEGPVSPRPPAAAFAGRGLPLCQRAARRAACGARLCARVLPLHALPEGRSAKDQSRSAAKHRSRRSATHRRRGDARPRPHQHAGERHGAGAARRRRAKTCRAPRRHHQRRRRRRSVGAEFSADPCRRPRRGRRAAVDRHGVGREQPPARDAHRQGGLLRHRRSRHQARLLACST